MGKDSCAFQGEESLTPSLRGQGCHLGGKNGSNPSPCGEAFVGRASHAFRGEEKA